MELVSDMLRIAMAEDGEETDEVKEEYGKKMEETLAGLREKLEEARRSEGKPPLTPPESQPAEVVDPSADSEVLSVQKVEELRAALAASQEKASSPPSVT